MRSTADSVRSAPRLPALLVLACLATASPAAAEQPGRSTQARVTLSAPRAQLDLDAAPPRVRLSVVAHNHLDVEVEAVQVGVLFAAKDEHLVGINPGAAYQAPTAAAGTVGAARHWLEVPLPAGQQTALSWHITLEPSAPDAHTFQTHVLGYRLAALNADLLFELIATEAAADEAAAVSSMALAGDREAKRRARERFAGRADLVAGITKRLSPPPTSEAGHPETMAWVLGIRSLGVLGGSSAESILRTLLDEPRLAHFDAQLQVLRVARAVGSELETPLAFAVPAESLSMRDVVVAALADATGTKPAPVQTAAVEVTAPGAAEDGGAPTASAVIAHLMEWPLWGILVAAALLAILFRRRRTMRMRDGPD